jgi:DNA-binding Lrp family transcriptional regulator
MCKMIKSLKDEKILASIIEDARIPLSKLAKQTRLSREIVQYRLKNLEKELIAGYQARINLRLFYNSVYTIYLNIQGLERKEIIGKLKKLSSVHWIGSTLGKWNYILTFSSDDSETLNRFLDKLSSLFSENSLKYALTQQISEYKDSYSGLFGKNLCIISQKNTGKINIDELDRKILDNLTNNARLSNEEIANKVDLTREAVRLRIKNLENQGVIINYRTLINPQALNLTSYFLAIKTQTHNISEINKLGQLLAANKSFSYVGATAGDFDIIGNLTVSSTKELDELINRIRNEFPKLIDELEILPLVEVNGQEYLPK